jgi:peptidoglycan-associated lipoprotein
MRRIVLAGVALLAAAACTPHIPYPECRVDDDCVDHGEVCLNGFCKQCRDDSNCAAHPDRPLCRDAICVAQPPPVAKEPAQRPCKADADCGDGQACVNDFCRAQGDVISPKAGRFGGCELKPVYFGFDDATLSQDARNTLDAEAQCLSKTQFRRMVLAGHTDERGTTEYNLALGERRADAVHRYLAQLGVDAQKLKSVSYGKERPADAAHTEAAWAKNRRVKLAPEP